MFNLENDSKKYFTFFTPLKKNPRCATHFLRKHLGKTSSNTKARGIEEKRFLLKRFFGQYLTHFPLNLSIKHF